MGRAVKKLPQPEPLWSERAGGRSVLVLNLKAVNPRIQLAFEVLQSTAFDHPHQLTAIAATLNVSISHLRHLFKKDLGVSPTHCVKLFRLQRAKELFETTFLSGKEVMYRVGITDPSHFVRDYKIAFGETPSQTRSSVERKLKSA